MNLSNMNRGLKRRREASSDSEDETQTNGTKTRPIQPDEPNSVGRCSLLSMLPKPKNSSFGPTVKLDKLLKLPERADQVKSDKKEQTTNTEEEKAAKDDIVEVDVSKVVGEVSHNLIKDLTVEKTKPNSVIIPKGKEKQKNQITYLAQLGKATELERKEQAAQSRINKAAARSKYGW